MSEGILWPEERNKGDLSDAWVTPTKEHKAWEVTHTSTVAEIKPDILQKVIRL